MGKDKCFFLSLLHLHCQKVSTVLNIHCMHVYILYICIILLLLGVTHYCKKHWSICTRPTQLLAQRPQTLLKMLLNTCRLSPAAKPTGGPGMAAPGATPPRPPVCSRTTQLVLTCPQEASPTSSLLHLAVPEVSPTPLLQDEVIL